MTNPEPQDQRRSFTSRTPANDNPDKVVYRRGFVTRHQVTGWRFVMRRIASGIALHDTRMLVDPLRTQSRAVLMGVLLLVTGLAGCFVFSFIRPSGSAGNNMVLADRSTAALYVRVGDELHPVLNLTSARLIVGQPANPTNVKSSELDRFPRGNLIGIPGAPERMVQNSSRDAKWTACDAIGGISRAAHSTGVTVIAGPLDNGGARAAALDPGHAILVGSPTEQGTSTWLLWDGKRSQIDLGDHAVTSALGLGSDASAAPASRPIAPGLFNAIPEAPPLTAPAIPNAGAPAGFSVPAPIGAVVVSYGLEPRDKTSSDTMRYFAVLPDGLQPISSVLAAILRNTNSYGLQQPPRLSADEVAKLPVSRLLDTARYPGQQSRPRRRGPRSRHVRVLEQAGRSRHQHPEPAVRLGTTGAGWAAHPRPGRLGQRRDPRRVGARHRLLHPERGRWCVRAGRRVVVLGLRHRGALRHRHRSRRTRENN